MSIKDKLIELQVPGNAEKIARNFSDLHTEDSCGILAWKNHSQDCITTAVVGNIDVIYNAIFPIFYLMFHGIPHEEFDSMDGVDALFSLLEDITAETEKMILSADIRKDIACNIVGNYTEKYVDKRVKDIASNIVSLGKHDTGIVSCAKDPSICIHYISPKVYPKQCETPKSNAEYYKDFVVRIAANAIIACGKEAEASVILKKVVYRICSLLAPDFMDEFTGDDGEEENDA